MERSDLGRPAGPGASAVAPEILALRGPDDVMPTGQPALVFACSEPVIAQRLLPRLGPRPLYVWRNPGPLLSVPASTKPDLEPLLEKAFQQQGVREIVICAHVGCQFLRQFWEGRYPGQELPASEEALALRQAVRSRARGANPAEIERTLAEQHVVSQIANLQAYRSVAQRLAEGKLRLHAWIFDEQAEALYGQGPADSPLLKWLRHAGGRAGPREPVFDPCQVYLA